MNQVNFDYWLDDIAPSMNGAEIPFIIRQIREAAIMFCDASWAWTLDALPINIIANDATYALVSPINHAEITKVIHAYVDGEEICNTSWTQLSREHSKHATKTGSVKSFVQDYVEQVRLFPIPDAAGVLTYKVALRPSRIAAGMDGSVGKRYFDAISDGAKARMYEIPNKPWSDGQASVFHKNKFESACQKAKDEVISGLGRRALRTVSYY